MSTGPYGDIYGSGMGVGQLAAQQNVAAQNEPRSEQVMVDMIRADLGVVIDSAGVAHVHSSSF